MNESKVTLVITSFNRLDLLKITTDSFNRMNTYPVKEKIIIDDSGLPKVHEKIKRDYPDYKLILNETNIGLIESIDKVYAEVTTPYVFHSEDDFRYLKPGFMEKSLKVLESNNWIMQVWLSNRHKEPLDNEIITADGVKYRLASINAMCGVWHGFTFIAGLRSMAGYEMTKPWMQWSDPKDGLSLRECKIGWEYFRLGYRAACLLDIPYCEHTGNYRTTW
jgi:hypothetical protein